MPGSCSYNNVQNRCVGITVDDPYQDPNPSNGSNQNQYIPEENGGFNCCCIKGEYMTLGNGVSYTCNCN